MWMKSSYAMVTVVFLGVCFATAVAGAVAGGVARVCALVY